MGYERNHAIVVADHGHSDALDKAHAQATALRAPVTPIVPGMINGVRSFAVLPDGSKEGWSESDVGDAMRDAFVAFLRTLYYEDGSSPLSWVEVQFGDDDHVTKALRSSDADYKKPRKPAVAPTDGGGANGG